MNRYPMWKNIFVAIMILIGLIYTIPNFFGESPAVQVTPSKSSTKLDPALLGQVEAIFKQEKIAYDGIYLDLRGVKARFANTDTQIKAKDVLQANLGDNLFDPSRVIVSTESDVDKSDVDKVVADCLGLGRTTTDRIISEAHFLPRTNAWNK